MESRLTELESKLTLAEHLLEELNLTVFRQQQQIDALQLRLRQLSLQLQASDPGEPRRPEDEIPPHY